PHDEGTVTDHNFRGEPFERCLRCDQTVEMPAEKAGETPAILSDQQIDNLLFSLRCNWPEEGSHARIVIRDKVRAFVAKNEPWPSPGIDNACRRFGQEMAVAQALETPDRLHEAETILA